MRGERLAALIHELVDARGRPVSTAALAEAVWLGAPPEDWAGALQALVSRVRRLGLPVEAVPGGYRVPADRIEIDAVAVRANVDRARAALRAGEPGTARAAADAARSAFPEVPELTGTEQTRLFSDLAAVRAEAALAGAGAFDEADLRRLVAHTPPDEPAAALLVRMLAAQGRDAEALDVFEQLRTDLADRYGTDPSPVLAEAHLALLRGELRTGPPPRRAAAALPRNWRRPVTALIGREADVLAVTAALAEAPLVTVVATGGAGKTRLAAEVARRRTGPVQVIELAGLRSPTEVLPAVLAAFGGSETVSAGAGMSLERRVLSPAERLRAVAAELDGLIVLDNCEHVLEAAAAVIAELLPAAGPEVAVLATSRAPLGLVGEVVHRLAVLPDAEALGLLEARARAGGAVPSWDRARALDLCHRLDNLPLALELAAARLRHMPIDDVLAGLSDRFALLDDALRGLPERHASLWAMVDWSRELLGAADRELLQRLAVIPAPFTAALAAAVAGDRDVRRGLANLVEQSLLSFDEDSGAPRYRMLETVREYGEARLEAAGDREPALTGLLGWARDQAIQLVALFIGPDQLDAFGRCAVEQENLVAALRRALETSDDVAAIDIAPALFHLWTVRGLHLEVSTWAGHLLHPGDPAARLRSPALRGREAGRPLPNADRLAWTCLLIGVNAGITGPIRLTALARRALRVLTAERPEQISARNTVLAAALPGFDAFDTETSLANADGLIADPDPFVQGMGLFLRAAMRENGGMPSASISDAERAYERFEVAGDHWGMAMTAQAVGQSVRSPDDDRSAEWLARGARHMEAVGAVQDARSLWLALDVEQALSGDAAAERRLRDVAIGPGDDGDAAQAALGLAHLARQRGRHDEALAYGDAVIRKVAGLPAAPPPVVLFQVAVAALYLWVAGARQDAGLAAHAAALLTAARDEALRSKDTPMIGAWALGGAELAAYRGADDAARELWSLGMRVGANLGNVFLPDLSDRLAAALGSEDERRRALAGWQGRPVATTGARIRALMDGLLRPSSGTPAAPTA